MREVIVKVKCDRCAATFDVENGDGSIQENFPFRFGEDDVQLDLCLECIEILENDLAALIAQGRRVHSAKKPKNGKPKTAESVGRRCPECAEQGVTRIIETPQGFAVHRYRAHGVRGKESARHDRRKAAAKK